MVFQTAFGWQSVSENPFIGVSDVKVTEMRKGMDRGLQTQGHWLTDRHTDAGKRGAVHRGFSASSETVTVAVGSCDVTIQVNHEAGHMMCCLLLSNRAEESLRGCTSEALSLYARVCVCVHVHRGFFVIRRPPVISMCYCNSAMSLCYKMYTHYSVPMTQTIYLTLKSNHEHADKHINTLIEDLWCTRWQ